MHRIDLADGIPSHEDRRPPTASTRRSVNNRILRAGRPMETIRRIVEIKMHRRGQRAMPLESLVALGGVCFVQILEEVGLDLFGRKNVVLLGPLVFNQPEDRFLPVHTILGRGQAGTGIGAVPHAEELLLLLVDHCVDPHFAAFPRFVRPQNGIGVRLFRRIQDPRGVTKALQQIVVDEQLLAGSDVEERRWANGPANHLLGGRIGLPGHWSRRGCLVRNSNSLGVLINGRLLRFRVRSEVDAGRRGRRDRHHRFRSATRISTRRPLNAAGRRLTATGKNHQGTKAANESAESGVRFEPHFPCPSLRKLSGGWCRPY